MCLAVEYFCHSKSYSQLDYDIVCLIGAGAMTEWLKALAACSSKGLGFDFQFPHSSSQLSITSVTVPSSDLHGCQEHTWCTDLEAGKILII